MRFYSIPRKFPSGYGWFSGWSARTLIVALLLSSRILLGQDHSAAPGSSRDGRTLFAELCAGCHGADALGTDRGPILAGSHSLRERSIAQLHDLIQKGIPTSGMPAFDLPARELDVLAAFVHSLNAPVAKGMVTGDPKAGERYFFGPGQCVSCHMVGGRGKPIGPDLSNAGNEMTIEEIREALLAPGSHVTPGYELVTVQLRDGQTIRGFARGRSNFDIQLQDLEGRFRLLQEDEISAIKEEKQSLMQPVNANPEELTDLIAYLGGLSGVKAGHPVAEPSSTGGIDFSRIQSPRPGDWLTYDGDLSGNRYSKLSQINATNVNKLAVKWVFTVPLWKQFLPHTAYFIENMRYFGLEVTPLVADGIMYTTGPHQAFALDALTGRVI